MEIPGRDSVGVRVNGVQIGGGAPVVVQSMTPTDTADPAAIVRSSTRSSVTWPAGRPSATEARPFVLTFQKYCDSSPGGRARRRCLHTSEPMASSQASYPFATPAPL
jgi:hypothetical protein